MWEDNQGWAQTKHIPEPPSTYYYRSVYGCFINDPHGLASLAEVGVDNVTCETDYPHSDSSWPDTKQIVTKLVAGLSDEVVHKVVRGNAIRAPRPHHCRRRSLAQRLAQLPLEHLAVGVAG